MDQRLISEKMPMEPNVIMQEEENRVRHRAGPDYKFGEQLRKIPHLGPLHFRTFIRLIRKMRTTNQLKKGKSTT